MLNVRLQPSLISLVALLALLAAAAAMPREASQASQTTHPSFAAFEASSIDRTWVTPIGVAGHHRTFGVTYSGDLGDLPISQFQSFYPIPMSKRPWVSGVQGVFYDAVGLAMGQPANFWGASGKLRQHLLKGRLPAVISESSEGELQIEQTAFAALPGGQTVSRRGDEPLLAYVRVKVKNTGAATQEPVVWIWRSGPSPTYGEIGGLTRKFEPVRLVHSEVIGEAGNRHLIFLPGTWKLSFDGSADTKDIRYFGRLSTTLPPGETAFFDFVYPYWPVNQPVAEQVARSTFDGMLATVVHNWETLLSAGMRVSVPDQKIGEAFDVGLINTLLLSRRVPWGLIPFDSLSFFTRETEPVNMRGTIRLGHYNLMYDDTAQKLTVHTFLETGHPEYAREVLESIFHAQGTAQPRGAAGQDGCLSAGNATAVGERGCSSVWMSGTGYSLWAAAEYYKYTHDADWLRKHREAIISAFHWIKNERHRPDDDKGHEGLMRGRGMCDSKLATYHPFNDIMSYWGMKEMVHVLVPLGLAGSDWVHEVNDYEHTIKTVYEADGLRAYQGFGGADYGLTAGAAIMSGLYSLDSDMGKKLVANSPSLGWYAMYLGRFMVEKDEVNKFLGTYYKLVANHMSHGTHCNGEWPLAKSPEDKDKSAINVQPHAHSNAAFHFMTRTMLVYEDETVIHLLRGIPTWWLTQTEQPIDVQQAPTTSGPMSFKVSRSGDRIETRLTFGGAAPVHRIVALHLPLPPGTHFSSVEINGQPSTAFDPIRNVVSVAGRRGTVRVVVYVK